VFFRSGHRHAAGTRKGVQGDEVANPIGVGTVGGLSGTLARNRFAVCRDSEAQPYRFLGFGVVKRGEEGSGSRSPSSERENLKGENVMRARLAGCGAISVAQYSSRPLCEGEKPSKPYVLTEFRTKRHGRMGAETFPNLRTAQCPEGEKLKSVAGLKHARSENVRGLRVPLTGSVETL
jgi:hypothetical protein